MLRLATGPVSWGVWRGSGPWVPWERFLDEAVEAGFRSIELGTYGFLPTDVGQLIGELESRGLSVAGGALMLDFGSAGWPEQWAEVDRSAERIARLGGGFLILVPPLYTDLQTGRVLDRDAQGVVAWQRLVELTNLIARHVAERWRLVTVFHPHADSDVEQVWQIDSFMASTDPALVGLCLDTGHVAYRGGDPAAVLRTHSLRVKYIHLKSVDPLIRDRVERLDLPFARALELGVFVPLSTGKVDFHNFARAVQEIGFDGWATIEQDVPNKEPFATALPLARQSLEYVRALGVA
jgi:inosose dehydratase